MADEWAVEITVGTGGWVEARWTQPDGVTAVAYLRVRRGRGKRWQLAELRLLEPSPETLRSLPLVKIERALDARRAADPSLPEWLGGGDAPDDVPGWFRAMRRELKRRHPKTLRFRLQRPDRRRLGDDFYADVARAYRDAVAAGLNPRKTLAEDAGIPADTIARWTAEARRRGHLEPAEPGKVSA